MRFSSELCVMVKLASFLLLCVKICVLNNPQCGKSPLISLVWNLLRANVCLGLWGAEREAVKEKREEEKPSERQRKSN